MSGWAWCELSRPAMSDADRSLEEDFGVSFITLEPSRMERRNDVHLSVHRIVCNVDLT